MSSLERALVGGVILSPASTDALPTELTVGSFSDLRLGQIYVTTVDLYRRHPELAGDVAAIVSELKSQGELDRVGGPIEVANLVSEACVSGAISWHATRIADAQRLRALNVAAVRIQQQVNSNPVPTEVEDAEAMIRFAWEQLESATTAVAMRNVRTLPEVYAAWTNRSTSPGIPIGFTLFNKITGLSGAHPGHLVLVAARPATGKSTALAQAAVAASASGVGVLYVTLEMVAEEVLERCMANQTAMSIRELREHGVTTFPDALTRISVIDSATAVTDISAVIRQSRRGAHPIQLVIVDYLQLLTPPGRSGENRQNEVAAISRALKRLAVEERVAVLAASQLNRASEARSDRKPSLADLRESGQLEQDSDVVVLMHRDADEPFEVVFTVAKNRHGAVGEWAVVADFSRSVFLETPGSDSVRAIG